MWDMYHSERKCWLAEYMEARNPYKSRWESNINKRNRKFTIEIDENFIEINTYHTLSKDMQWLEIAEV